MRTRESERVKGEGMGLRLGHDRAGKENEADSAADEIKIVMVLRGRRPSLLVCFSILAI